MLSKHRYKKVFPVSICQCPPMVDNNQIDRWLMADTKNLFTNYFEFS